MVPGGTRNCLCLSTNSFDLEVLASAAYLGLGSISLGARQDVLMTQDF